MLTEGNIELSFENFPLGLSARRLWEHTECRQVNPFPAITSYSATQPEAYVDVVTIIDTYQKYPGISLEDVQQEKIRLEFGSELLKRLSYPTVQQWLRDVGRHLNKTYDRRAVRNVPEPFLQLGPPGPLGIPGINCALSDWLSQREKEKATPQQWLNRIRNLTSKGLKKEELDLGGLVRVLNHEDLTRSITGNWLLSLLNFGQLRLSIVPVVTSAINHLEWLPVAPFNYIKRIKPKIKGSVLTVPKWRDPVLGYWIDKVEWDDLLGPVRGWMAFNYRGSPLITPDRPTGLFDTPEAAKTEANHDAARVLPRLTAKGNWAQYRLTGGENYREWLITLPFYPPTYDSGHFVHRNVLLHVRCDIREGDKGQKILFLQEIQSDWAQEARRVYQDPVEDDRGMVPLSPWLKEWPRLALKLMMLHAAERGYEALAWTTGADQAERYGGLGEAGLRTLYDHTLPREADKILKPYGILHQSIPMFMPDNFFIEPCEEGYQVFDHHKTLIGRASTWHKAQKMIPDGAIEKLVDMHGVWLENGQRQEILRRGFFAWGTGIK